MPERSIRIHQTDQPWMTSHLKRLIERRQKAFAAGHDLLYKLLRNKVNRERKRCQMIYYNNKVRDLKDTKPRDWWRAVKQLCGSTKANRPDLRSIMKNEVKCTDQELVDKVNEAFVSVTKDYLPLANDVCVSLEDDVPITVTDTSVTRKLRQISASKASGPDNLPNWLLKEYADILAPAVVDI